MTRPQGTPARVEPLDPRLDRGRADPGVDQLPQALAMAHAGVVVGERGVLQQMREVERLEEAPDVHLGAGRDRDLAVGGVEQAVGIDHRVIVAGALGQRAGREVLRREVREHADQAAGEAGLDPLALTGCDRPTRGRRAATRAATMPSAAYSPATRSAIGGPARTGSPGAPVTLMNPLIAWAMKSNAGRST